MTNTPAPELVEKVARAISAVNAGGPNPNWRLWLDHAQAALSSIPPTPEITEDEAREILNRTPHAAGCSATLDTGTGQLSCDCDRALRAIQQSTRAPDREAMPDDVRRLVIAARMVAWEDPDPANLKELQEASELFAARVPWDDAPEDEVTP